MIEPVYEEDPCLTALYLLKCKRAYFYLAEQVEEALTAMEKESIPEFENARKKLKAALLEAKKCTVMEEI